MSHGKRISFSADAEVEEDSADSNGLSATRLSAGDGERRPMRASRQSMMRRSVYSEAGPLAQSQLASQLASMPQNEDRHSPFRGRHYALEGVTSDAAMDIFHKLLTTPWWILLAISFFSYMLLILLFAFLYLLDPTGFQAGVKESHGFGDIFYFSMQTLSTIGYGHLAPLSGWANMVALLESFTGIVFTAFVTGSLFAKLSRPVARIKFARRVLLQQDVETGKWHLVFRLANQRRTPILNMKVNISVLLRAKRKGESSFAYKSLSLDVQNIALFVGGARLRHVIDENSPLFGLRRPEDAEHLGIFSYLAIVQGTEEVYGNHISARHIYDPTDVRYNPPLDVQLGCTEHLYIFHVPCDMYIYRNINTRLPVEDEYASRPYLQALMGYTFRQLLDEDKATGKLTLHLSRLDELVPAGEDDFNRNESGAEYEDNSSNTFGLSS